MRPLYQSKQTEMQKKMTEEQPKGGEGNKMEGVWSEEEEPVPKGKGVRSYPIVQGYKPRTDSVSSITQNPTRVYSEGLLPGKCSVNLC